MNDMKWEHYIEKYGKDIYSFCMFLTKNKQEADDLYQDTFLRGMEKDEICEWNNPKAYLIGIAVNVWNNKKRKFLWRKNRADIVFYEDELVVSQIQDEAASVEMQVVRKQNITEVREAVLQLPEKMRMVVLMFYMEEMTVEEISKILGIPRGTVKSRLHSARIQLRNVMEEINHAG